MKAKPFALFALLVIFAALAGAQSAGETGKVIVAHYKFTDTGIVETQSSVVYGLPPDMKDTGPYTAKVLDSSGASLDESQFSDPRIYFGDELTDQGMQPTSGFNPDAELILVLPFDTSMSALVISNTTSGEKLFEADLGSKVDDFCASHPQDVDCAKIPPKEKVSDFSSLFLPALVVIVLAGIVVAFIFMRKKCQGKTDKDDMDSGEGKTAQ